MRKAIVVVLLGAAIVLVGCRNQNAKPESINVFPSVVGSTWVYEELGVIEDSRVAVQYQILPYTSVDGRRVLPILEKEEQGVPVTTFYEVESGVATVVAESIGNRSPELLSDHTAVPTQLTIGQEWSNGIFKYRVIGQEPVTVRAGHFPVAYVVEMSGAGYIDKLYYVDGIGVVKQGPVNVRELLEWKPGGVQADGESGSPA